LEILGLIVEGKSNREIGEALFVSPRTVDNHVSSILAKLEVPSRTAAVAAARRLDLA
jgi:DNA-binding NarL/FixJ family response regulator